MLIANKLWFIRLFKSSLGIRPLRSFLVDAAGRQGPYEPHANRQCMMAELVGLFAALLLVANAMFQLALAAGVRWGNAAYGGKVAQDDGSLPTRYRIMSLVSAMFMGILILVILSASGIATSSPLSTGATVWACRGASMLFALNTAGNLTSTSKVERWVMGSATTCLTIAFALIGWVL